MDFAYSDLEPVFEECLQEICALLGRPYTPEPGVPAGYGDGEDGAADHPAGETRTRG